MSGKPFLIYSACNQEWACRYRGEALWDESIAGIIRQMAMLSEALHDR